MKIVKVIEYRSGEWAFRGGIPEWASHPSALVELSNGLRAEVFLPEGPEALDGIPHSERANATRATCLLRLGEQATPVQEP